MVTSFLGEVSMRHDENHNRQNSDMCSEGFFFKERRKAYYHGKYHKRMLSLLLLVTAVAVMIVSQGA